MKTGGLFSKRKDFKQEAEANREKKINILEKVPVKGIRIPEIDPHHEVYIKDEEGRKTACAPVEILFEAETSGGCHSISAVQGFLRSDTPISGQDQPQPA